MALQSQVDRKVQSFSSWKAELHAEDFKELGQLVHRRDEDYQLLYSMYCKFQRSPKVVAMRKEIFIN